MNEQNLEQITIRVTGYRDLIAEYSSSGRLRSSETAFQDILSQYLFSLANP
jgi:hypothetical protein